MDTRGARIAPAASLGAANSSLAYPFGPRISRSRSSRGRALKAPIHACTVAAGAIVVLVIMALVLVLGGLDSLDSLLDLIPRGGGEIDIDIGAGTPAP